MQSKSTDEYCEPSPTCFLSPEGETEVDTGRCALGKCTVRNSDELTGNTLCCGQIATEVIEAESEGELFHTMKITACGCIECPEGEEITIDGEVYVEGIEEVVEHASSAEDRRFTGRYIKVSTGRSISR